MIGGRGGLAGHLTRGKGAGWRGVAVLKRLARMKDA